MKDLTKVYIDLSKCTEEQQKHIFSLLPPAVVSRQYKIEAEHVELHLHNNDWWVLNHGTRRKTELTYPEFIKLFEGGEEEKEIDIEKMAKEALKFQHKNIQDRMIDFVLGFEEGFKKAMELNSNR